ncbi:hypothetical protein C1H46_013989 [Malus baccata]|uniref:Uncharacterized protein n=1 Tax=Malus baccata TaxID=106549 RepID=A0A540MNP3_MALBA|nr:hypothetical protein C1H46_013989 [Malus baccata]
MEVAESTLGDIWCFKSGARSFLRFAWTKFVQCDGRLVSVLRWVLDVLLGNGI